MHYMKKNNKLTGFLSALALVSLCTGLTASCGNCQEGKKVKPTKNLILMIPDGTSTSTLSVLRWYREYLNPQDCKATLSIDPYICGLVRQYCSDAPVIESSAAMTSFMTGYRVQGPNICVYPKPHPGQDLLKVSPDSTWQPLATVLEGAKILANKATGLVVTVKATHATPAGTYAHVVSRYDDFNIVRQMASNGVDLVFGGGTAYVDDDVRDILKDKGTQYIEKDVNAFRGLDTYKAWALFADKDLAFEMDRDSTKEPSLTEMTAKAISLLSKSPEGFFLMVEGSKVDYAAHSNDPAGLISEFDEFDKAVAEAIEFAKKDGNTTVVVVPDHGNASPNIGDRFYRDYDMKGIDSAFVMLPQYKATANGIANAIKLCDKSEVREVFREYTGIDLSESEEVKLLAAMAHIEKNYMNVSYSRNLVATVTSIMNAHTHIGYVSGSHTAEDVFLAVYNPNGQVPRGWMEGTDLAGYMWEVLGLDKPRGWLTSELYVKSDVLLKGHEVEVEGDEKEPDLVIDGNVRIPANRSYAIKDGKKIPLGSVSVYVPQNKNFYISKRVLEIL